jgi:hypothetical protein
MDSKIILAGAIVFPRCWPLGCSGMRLTALTIPATETDLQARPATLRKSAGSRTARAMIRPPQLAASFISEAAYENRKTPISKPAANAQRPNVQAETTRTRLRRSCGISWDRPVIATIPLSSNLLGPSFIDRAASRPPGYALNPNSGHRLSGFRHCRFSVA